MSLEESTGSVIGPLPSLLDDRVDVDAIEFALRAHRGQCRNDGSPFVVHTLEVASLLGLINPDHEVVAAGVLHDVLKRSAVTPAELQARFGRGSPRSCRLSPRSRGSPATPSARPRCARERSPGGSDAATGVRRRQGR